MKKIIMAMTIFLLVVSVQNLFQVLDIYKFFGNGLSSSWSVFLVKIIVAIFIFAICRFFVRLFPGLEYLEWSAFFVKKN